jgi:hypothetical protein
MWDEATRTNRLCGLFLPLFTTKIFFILFSVNRKKHPYNPYAPLDAASNAACINRIR